MQVKNLFTDDRAVSPVVGVALLIAIAVILAVVIGAVVLNLGPGGANAPSVDAAANYSDTNDKLTLTHRGGDPLNRGEVVFTNGSGEYTLDQAMTDDGISADKLTAGQSVEVTASESGFDLSSTDGDDAETIRLIWEAPNGDKTIVIDTFNP